MQTTILVPENDQNTFNLLAHRISEVGIVCNDTFRFKSDSNNFITVFSKALSQNELIVISAPFKYSRNLAQHLNLNLKASKKAIEYIECYCKSNDKNPILYKEKVIIPQGSAPIEGEDGNIGFILPYRKKTIVFLTESPDEVQLHTLCGILKNFTQQNEPKSKPKKDNILKYNKKIFVFALLGILTVFLFAGICLAFKNCNSDPQNNSSLQPDESIALEDSNTVSESKISAPAVIMTGEAVEPTDEQSENKSSKTTKSSTESPISQEQSSSSKEQVSSSQEPASEESPQIPQKVPVPSDIPIPEVPTSSQAVLPPEIPIPSEAVPPPEIPVPPEAVSPPEIPVPPEIPPAEISEIPEDNSPMEFVMDDEQLKKDKLFEEQLEKQQKELEESLKQQQQQQDNDDNEYDNENTDADYDEILYIRNNGVVKKINSYDLVLQAVQSETHGCMSLEALKAQAVATYTFFKYNNKMNIYPTAGLLTPISRSVKKAVDAVFGQACYYNGKYINSVYHSTSSGKTTSSKDVWGGSVPYLVSVDSPWDKNAPKYHTAICITADNLYDAIVKTYNIYPEGDKTEWIKVYHDADGDYTGSVTVSGYNTSQGGTAGNGKKITGRSIREQLMAFTLRSHCFDVTYDENNDKFRFDVYGYGHGVGMSQYGADFMAKDGYDYKEILTHYYSEIEIK